MKLYLLGGIYPPATTTESNSVWDLRVDCRPCMSGNCVLKVHPLLSHVQLKSKEDCDLNEMQQKDDVEDEDQMSEEDGDLDTDSILHRLMEI